MTAPHDPDAIIACVLGRHVDRREEPRRPRNLLVLDRDLAALEPALIEARFRILVPQHLEDRPSREACLRHRMLMTKSTTKFLSDAPALDFGIVGLDALPIVDAAPRWDENPTARLILEAACKFNLHYERGAWVLMLHPASEHVFVRLV